MGFGQIKGIRIGLPLSPRELEAIGYITAQWAMLEHYVFAHTIYACTVANISPPKEAYSVAIRSRLRAWSTVVCNHLPDDHYKKDASTLVKQIIKLKLKRHRVSHALWSWDDERQPEEEITTQSFLPAGKFKWDLDEKRLTRLGHEIAETNAQLEFLFGPPKIVPPPSRRRFPPRRR